MNCSTWCSFCVCKIRYLVLGLRTTSVWKIWSRWSSQRSWSWTPKRSWSQSQSIQRSPWSSLECVTSYLKINVSSKMYGILLVLSNQTRGNHHRTPCDTLILWSHGPNVKMTNRPRNSRPHPLTGFRCEQCAMALLSNEYLNPCIGSDHDVGRDSDVRARCPHLCRLLTIPSPTENIMTWLQACWNVNQNRQVLYG